MSNVAAVTDDKDKLISALKDSKAVSLSEDGSQVKPNIKVEVALTLAAHRADPLSFQMERDTIILREVPEDTTEEDIMGLFANKEEKPVHIRNEKEIWFITMRDEETATDTVWSFRDMKLKDKPIRARLRSENPLRTAIMAARSGGPAVAPRAG